MQPRPPLQNSFSSSALHAHLQETACNFLLGRISDGETKARTAAGLSAAQRPQGLGVRTRPPDWRSVRSHRVVARLIHAAPPRRRRPTVAEPSGSDAGPPEQVAPEALKGGARRAGLAQENASYSPSMRKPRLTNATAPPSPSPSMEPPRLIHSAPGLPDTCPLPHPSAANAAAAASMSGPAADTPSAIQICR